jgi:cell division protein FtsB
LTLDALGYRLYRLKREAGRHWLGVILVLTLAYFGYHSVHGSRGLFAWVDRNHELEVKRLELKQIRGERQWLEERVEALGDDGIAIDLLEETLYELGFVHENEVVILDPQPSSGTAE